MASQLEDRDGRKRFRLGLICALHQAARRVALTLTDSPARVAMSTRESRLNRSILPRSRSLRRAWVNPRRFADSVWVVFQPSTIFRTASITCDRAFMLAASCGEDSIASHTLANF